MRCRDVSRAIAALPGAMTESEIQAHLAACPRCAKLAEGVRRLDRLWDATRPEPPSAASWDSAWARIEHELATAPQPAGVVGETTTRRTLPISARVPAARLAIGLALAAAAVVLLAFNLPRPAPQFADNGAAQRSQPVYGTLDVPVGHTVLYHVDSAEHRVVQVSEPMTSGEDDLTFFRQSELGLDSVDYFALFGWFEAMPALTASAPAGESASPFDSRP